MEKMFFVFGKGFWVRVGKRETVGCCAGNLSKWLLVYYNLLFFNKDINSTIFTQKMEPSADDLIDLLL